VEAEELEAATLETIRQNGLRDGYIRLVVTRGKGNLGLSPDRCPKASVIIIAATIQLYPPEIRDWIARHGGLTPTIIMMRGRDLAALFKTCQ